LAVSVLQSDARLKKTVSIEAPQQPLKEVLSQLSRALAVPLRADPQLSESRLTVRLQRQTGADVLTWLAGILHGEWFKEGQGYVLRRTAEIKVEQASLAAQMQARVAEMLKREEERDRERKRQNSEFVSTLMVQSRLTDEQILKLAEQYPVVYETLTATPLPDAPADGAAVARLGARVLTWLSPEQRDKVMHGGLRLNREEVLTTGGDLGLNFERLELRLQENGYFVVGIDIKLNDRWGRYVGVPFN
jgi:hypothetical protein